MRVTLVLAWSTVVVFGSVFGSKPKGTITCPLRNASNFQEFYIVNASENYCGPVSIRTCSNEDGCTGMPYRNTTTEYQRCDLEYMAPTNCTSYPCKHSDWEAYVQLPAKVRVDTDTKYVVFACDPDPGHIVPTVHEFWPKGGSMANLTLPPMATMDCTGWTQDTASPYDWKGWHPFHCPWMKEGEASHPSELSGNGYCDACTDCRPNKSPSTYNQFYNFTFDNSRMPVTWRIDLMMGSYGGGARTTCAFGKGHRGEGRGDMSPGMGPDADQYLVPPNSVVHMAIPPNVGQIMAIPMYTNQYGTCVLQQRSTNNFYPPVLDLSQRYQRDVNGTQIAMGCIDSQECYPGQTVPGSWNCTTPAMAPPLPSN